MGAVKRANVKSDERGFMGYIDIREGEGAGGRN